MPRCKTPLKQTTEMRIAPNAHLVEKDVVNAAKVAEIKALKVALIALNQIAKQLAMLMPHPTRKLAAEKLETKPTTPHLSAANVVHVTGMAVTAENAIQAAKTKAQTKLPTKR